MGLPVRLVLTLGLAVSALGLGQAAAAPNVATSIKPVHSLVAGVMAGIGEPTLLVKGGGSPHSYSLRPSDARALNRADVVFWIGADMETFLEKPLKALAGRARVVTLASSPGIALLESRAGGAWEGHGDHDEGAEHGEHEEHEEHGKHEEHEKHGEHEEHEEHGKHEEHEKHGEHEEHEEHEEHAEHGARDGHEDHGAHNLHIWLDPRNAKQILRAAVDALSQADPANADRFAANAATLSARIDRLDREIAATLAPVKDVPYVVFHDAYPYFEAHYGTNAVGSITLSPERAPGAKRLAEVRRKIVRARAACVFSEPQFQPALVETVIEGTQAKAAVLDPLGAALDPGPEAYFQVMRGLAGSLRTCLTPAS